MLNGPLCDHLLRQPSCTAGDLGAASSAAIDIAEQTPEQLQPLLLPAVTLLPGLAEQVTLNVCCHIISFKRLS